MKSRYLINLLLVIIVLVLYWFNSQTVPSSDNSYSPLTSIARESITSITITSPNNDTILLTKQDNGWQLIQPLTAKANDTRIQLILSLLSTASFAQLTPKDDTKLSRFELNDSSPSVRLNDQLFQFGATETLSKHRYIFYKDTIHLIDDHVSPLLNASASSFIENRLFALNKTIKTLSLPTLDADNRLSKDTITVTQHNGHWQTNDVTLSADALTSLIQTWQHAYATQVLPLTDKEQAAAIQHTVEITFKNQPAKISLSILVNENSLSIIDDQSQLKYQFPISMLNQLFAVTDRPQ
ncbi:MAG: DUF4340 domain-containing protein [Gammaproteobacteria bacterium]|nr:DUF4340 domain-containing protein [Gammaproteobacteria bacterium]